MCMMIMFIDDIIGIDDVMIILKPPTKKTNIVIILKFTTHTYIHTYIISGCVPKKLMVFASRYPGEIKEMSGYGWKGATEGTFDWKVFLENKNQVCNNNLCALLIICTHI